MNYLLFSHQQVRRHYQVDLQEPVLFFYMHRYVERYLGIIGMFYLCRIICNIGYINTKKVFDFDIPWYGIFIVFVTIIVTTGVVYSVNSKEEYINPSIYPVDMVTYMKENMDIIALKVATELLD